jgi:hypothetical protein
MHPAYSAHMVVETSYMPKHFNMEQDLLDHLGSRSGCQRCIHGQMGEMLLVVHDVPQPGVPERKALFFWKDQYDGWHGCRGQGLQGLQQLLDDYGAAIDVHEAVIDDADTAKEIFDILRHAGPLSRSTRNLFMALQEALAKRPQDKELRNLSDRALENERAADLLYADARVTLEFIRAERAEEQAKSADRLAKLGFRLNLLAGFFLPLVALGGLMGMNVNLPTFTHDGFWYIVAGGLVFGALIFLLVGYNTGDKGDSA